MFVFPAFDQTPAIAMSNILKLVLTLLIAVTVGVSGLWITGGKKAEYSTALEIEGAPEVIFSYLTEPKRLKGWMTGLLMVGPFKVNEVTELNTPHRETTLRLVAIDGQQVQYQDDVIRFEQDKAITVQSTNSSVVLTAIFRLEPTGDQTKLTYRVTTRNHGIGRLLAPLSKSSVQTRIESEIRNLKALVETPAS